MRYLDQILIGALILLLGGFAYIVMTEDVDLDHLPAYEVR
jgi:hypothetical protein